MGIPVNLYVDEKSNKQEIKKENKTFPKESKAIERKTIKLLR